MASLREVEQSVKCTLLLQPYTTSPSLFLLLFICESFTVLYYILTPNPIPEQTSFY